MKQYINPNNKYLNFVLGTFFGISLVILWSHYISKRQERVDQMWERIEQLTETRAELTKKLEECQNSLQKPN